MRVGLTVQARWKGVPGEVGGSRVAFKISDTAVFHRSGRFRINANAL